MKSTSQRWLLPALLLIIAGLVSFVAQAFFLPGDIEPRDWERGAEFLAAQVGPDDLINVQPQWSEAPYPYLTDFGDQILRQKNPLLEDIFDAKNLWVIMERARAERVLGSLPFKAAETQDFGTISVARVEVTQPNPVRFSLLENLDKAKVDQITPAGEVFKECTRWERRDRAWHCEKKDAWIYVGEDYLTLGDDPHRCIRANPPASPQRWRIKFPEVPMTELFRFRGGLGFLAARSQRGEDVDIKIMIGEELSETRTIPARESSWDAIDFDTSELSGRTADIAIEVSSASIFDRFFCFNGWAIADSP